MPTMIFIGIVHPIRGLVRLEPDSFRYIYVPEKCIFLLTFLMTPFTPKKIVHIFVVQAKELQISSAAYYTCLASPTHSQMGKR